MDKTTRILKAFKKGVSRGKAEEFVLPNLSGVQHEIKAGTHSITTDDLKEGSNNLYFKSERETDPVFSAWDKDHADLTNVTSDQHHARYTDNEAVAAVETAGYFKDQTDIDHNQITNTHNLTTDIDHNQLTNYDSNRHFLESEIDHLNILNIGTNTHSQIDSHISGTGTNVHGDSFLLNTGDTATGDYTFNGSVLKIDSVNNRVGIGTTSPSTELEISGSTKMTGFQLTTGASDGYVLKSDANGVGTWAASTSTAGGSDGQIQYNDGGSIGGAELYFDDVNNRLGIGTASPSAELDVSGSIVVNGTVDGQDLDVRLDQDVKTTDSPTFAGLTINGNIAVSGTVDGQDISARLDQNVKTTSSPQFARVKLTNSGDSGGSTNPLTFDGTGYLQQFILDANEDVFLETGQDASRSWIRFTPTNRQGTVSTVRPLEIWWDLNSTASPHLRILDINEYGSRSSLTVKDGGTIVQEIHDGGITDFPKQSRARAYKSSSQTLTGGVTTKIALAAKNYDEHNEFDSTTNYRFTATKAGYYLVTAKLEVTPDGVSTDVLVYIFKNGANHAGNGIYRPWQTHVQVTDIVYLDVGDYIEMYGFVNRTRPVSTHSASTFMAIHKLS